MLSAYFVGQVGARNMASRFENMAKAGEEEAAKRREEEKSKREAREKAEREKQEKAEQERLARLAEQEAQRAPVGCVSVMVSLKATVIILPKIYLNLMVILRS